MEQGGIGTGMQCGQRDPCSRRAEGGHPPWRRRVLSLCASLPRGSGCRRPGGRHGGDCPVRVSPPSREAEGTGWSPAPTQPLALLPHTRVAVAPTHNLGFYCADRGTLLEDRLLFVVAFRRVLFFSPLTEFLLRQAVETTTNVHKKMRLETHPRSAGWALCACPGAHQQAQGAGRSQTSAIHGLSSTRQQASRQGRAGNGHGVGGSSRCLEKRKEWGAAAVNCSQLWWHSPGCSGSSVARGFTPWTRTLLPASSPAPCPPLGECAATPDLRPLSLRLVGLLLAWELPGFGKLGQQPTGFSGSLRGTGAGLGWQR